METIRLIINIVSALLSLGLPPAVADEAAFRKWLEGLADALKTVANMTGTTLDDDFLKLLELATTQDDVWALVYRIIETALGVEDGPVTRAHDPDGCLALGEKTGLDPATIIAIISAIVELIKIWRKKT